MAIFKRSYIPIQTRSLLWQFARRDVLGRYRGSVFGVLWSFLSPLLMLGVYSFVFIGVFRATWPGSPHGGGVEFSLQIFAGLLVFNLFAEVVGRAPNLIVEQPNLVKKVIFPIELLAWVSVLSGLFHVLISVISLTAVMLFIRGAVPWTIVSLPLVLLVFVPMLLGIAWFLSALGVFVRDIGQIVTMVISLTMFMSPIFYSIDSLDMKWRFWLNLNPLTFLIEQVRSVTLIGHWPDWGGLVAYGLISCSVAILGAAFFQLTRKGFADVL